MAKGNLSFKQIAAREAKKAVKSAFRKKVEVKHEMLAPPPVSTDTVGVIIPLMNDVSTGTAHDQRIGNKVTLLSNTLRLQVALADTGYNNIRYAIIKTRREAINTADLFENASYLQFGGVYASWDYDMVERVYLDKNLTLNQLIPYTTNLGESWRSSKFRKHFNKMPMEIHYDDSAAGSVLDRLYLILCSDSAVIPHPRVAFVSRCRFTDL